MTVNLTPEETQFLINNLLSPDQAAPVYLPEARLLVSRKLMNLSPIQLDSTDVSFLQYVLQELSEIHGRQSSTANEKQSIAPGHRFRPQRTLALLQSISDKLGASLKIDTTQHLDQHSPNESGSRGIMSPQGSGI